MRLERFSSGSLNRVIEPCPSTTAVSPNKGMSPGSTKPKRRPIRSGHRAQPSRIAAESRELWDWPPNRNLDALDVEESELVFPVELSRRNPGVRQPVERDVVEDIVTRKATRVSGEGTGDELVTLRVVVEHPGR